MGYMQNISVFFFFVLIHLPLSQLNAAFSFLTAFTVWFVDNKTKATIYYTCTFVTRVMVSPREAFKKWKKDRKIDPLGDLGRTQIDREILSKKDKERLKAVVDWVCLNVAIFYAILLNYLYTTFLHDLTVMVVKNAIHVLDRAGFEAHFLRFIHMTLFEQDGVSENTKVHTAYQIFDLVSMDAFLIITIVLPLFLAAMHFFTAPFKKLYDNKLQILIAPLAIIPFFCFTNIDVAILSALVLIQNGYIAWYVIDRAEFADMYQDEYEYEHENDADYGESIRS